MITVTSRNAVRLSPDYTYEVKGDTIYYGQSSDVSAADNDGSVDVDDVYSPEIETWVISASSSNLNDKPVDFDVEGSVESGEITWPLEKANFGTVGADAIKLAVSGDDNDRFVVNANGKLEWGGGTDALDINLYRGDEDQLQTDDQFLAESILSFPGSTGQIAITSTTGVDTGTPIIEFGTGPSADLYSNTAGVLRTSGLFRVDGTLEVGPQTTWAAYINTNYGVGMYPAGATDRAFSTSSWEDAQNRYIINASASSQQLDNFEI